MGTIDLTQRSYSKAPSAHSHTFHQIVIPLQGELEIQIGYAQGVLCADRAGFICAQETHEFAAPEGNNQFLVADIPIDQAPRIASLSPFFSLSYAAQQYRSFLAASLESIDSAALRSQVSALAVALLEDGAEAQYDRRVAAAKCYIERHFHLDINVRNVADAAALSPRQLNALFKAQVGTTVHAYVVRCRMERARDLLLTSSATITDIAAAVGYDSAAAFSYRFRQFFDRSPRYYRQNA